MRAPRSLRSFRLLVGGIAAALGFGATTTQVLGVSAEPVTTDHTPRLDPAALPAPGTYQSCTAQFGLHKSTSDLATFDVVVGANPVTPTPVMGVNIIPIVTISDGTNTVTCEAVLGWTDQATFESDYIVNTFEVGSSATYPGTGYYLLPAVGVSQFDGSTNWTPTTRTLAFPNDLPAGTTVTAVPPDGPSNPFIFTVASTVPTSVSDLSTPFYQRVFAAIASAPTGSQAQADYLRDRLIESILHSPSPCSDSNQTLIDLVATMQALSTGFYDYFVGHNCSDVVQWGSVTLGDILTFDQQVGVAGVSVTVNGPTPAPTTTTTPSEPVAPAFTG